jgi:hypothetical protein
MSLPPDATAGSRVSPMLDMGKSSQSHDDASKEEDDTRGCHRRQLKQGFLPPDIDPRVPQNHADGHEEMTTPLPRGMP